MRGGFGGLACAKALAGSDMAVTLIDRQNHHLFQPLLYQVATAGLSAVEVASPVRRVFRDAPNVRVLMDEIRGLDLEARAVRLANGPDQP